MHLSDAVLESVMVFRLGAGAGAVAEVVVPLCLAKAGFLSGCTVIVLGIVAATEKYRDFSLRYGEGCQAGRLLLRNTHTQTDGILRKIRMGP